MKRIVLLLAASLSLLICGLNANAQDTTQTEIYDIVNLKKGGIIKGTILSFNEQTGIVVIEDTDGRKYTLGREEYDYIEENVEFAKKKKKDRVIHPRKTEEFEFSVGLEAGYANLQSDTKTDENFVGKFRDYSNIPSVLNINAGKYVNERLYVGLASDINIASYATSGFNLGVRALSLNPTTKRNAAFYFPAEIYYSTMEFPADFEGIDSTVNYPGFGTEIYSSDRDVDIKMNSIGLSVGAGVNWAMRNKRSVGFEVTVFTHTSVNTEILTPLDHQPDYNFTLNGFRFALYYNL
jgi:opacity protein-like surface antigen